MSARNPCRMMITMNRRAKQLSFCLCISYYCTGINFNCIKSLLVDVEIQELFLKYFSGLIRSRSRLDIASVAIKRGA